jgi:hypothetical protein
VPGGLVHPQLTARVRRRIGALSHESSRRVRASIPGFAPLPDPEIDKQREAVARTLEAILDITDGGTPDLTENRVALAAAAAHRARQGLALSDVLSTYDVSWVVCVRGILDLADGPDHASAEQLITVSKELLPAIQEGSRSGYYAELARQGSGSALAEALLGGLSTGSDGPAPQHTGYWVLVVRCAAAVPPGWTPPPLPREVLVTVRAYEVVALVPAHGERHQDRPDLVDAAYRALTDRLPMSTAGTDLATGPDLVPGSYAHAAQAAALASPLQERPLGITDVLVDIAVSADPDLVRALTRPIETLAAHPDLLTTLEAFYALDMDRAKVARREGVHRNTVDYRLRRIQQLVGIDPTGVHGIRTFTAGLTAWRTGR